MFYKPRTKNKHVITAKEAVEKARRGEKEGPVRSLVEVYLSPFSRSSKVKNGTGSPHKTRLTQSLFFTNIIFQQPLSQDLT